MKHLAVLVMLSVLFHTVSCTRNDRPPSDVAAQNVDIIAGMYDAFARGDVPAALEKMDPDIQWYEAEGNPYADGNPYLGPQAVVDGVFQRLGGEWENFRTVDIEIIGAPTGEVVSTGRYRGKFLKTGKEIDAQFAHKYWLKDGKVARFQQYVDTRQMVAAME